MAHINSTITSGGTAQVGLVPGDYTYVLIQNNSNEDLWIKFADTYKGAVTAAADSGIRVPASGAVELPDCKFVNNGMSIIGATTGSKFGITTE